VEAAVTADDCDRRAEKHTFKNSVKQVPVVDELLRVVPVVIGIDAEYLDTVHPAARDAHEDGHDREGWDHQQASEEAGHDEIVNWVRAH
jgi:hypothetical protein